MITEQKIEQFINRAQSKIAQLAIDTAGELYEAYSDSSSSELANELIDVIYNLRSELLDWTNYEIEKVVNYYTYKARLNDIALLQFNDVSQTIISGGTVVVDSSWIPSFNALNATVISNRAQLLLEIQRLDNVIATLNFDGLIPQQILDSIQDSATKSHTHNNKTILDALTQQHINHITSMIAHVGDFSIHVTAMQKTAWDNKVSLTQLTEGLATKANLSHTHTIPDIAGLTQLLESYVPIPGPKGQDGITPSIEIGSFQIGDALFIEMDNSNPAYPQLHFTIPMGKDGEDFKIQAFGAAAARLSNTYNSAELGYTYLGTDNGILYFRRPTDASNNPISATIAAGWFAIKFMGSDGWAPILGVQIISDTRVVLTLEGWTGGTGITPTLGSDPTHKVYLGPSGFTHTQEDAINIRGAQGIAGNTGKIMFPDESGTTAQRDQYNAREKDFVFYDNQIGMIYKKNSDAIGDWSQGFPWNYITVDDSLIANSTNPVTSRAIQSALSQIGNQYFEIVNGRLRTKDGQKLDAADIINLPSGGVEGHLPNKDQFLDEGGPNEVSALALKAGLTALTNKVDKVTGKDLSTNDFTNGHKDKVDKVIINGTGNKYKADDGNYKTSVDANSMVLTQLNLYDHSLGTVGIWRVVNNVLVKV